MGFEMCRIDHQSIRLARFAGKRLENPVEDAHLAPAGATGVEPQYGRLCLLEFKKVAWPPIIP